MITVNGRQYENIKDVPKEYKVMFQDSNNNGVPDFVEGLLAGTGDIPVAGSNPAINANFSSFFFNGRQYGDINQLPPEAKALVERSLARLEKSGFKLANVFEHDPKNSEQTNQSVDVQNGQDVTGGVPESLRNDAVTGDEPQLSPNFKSRLVITILLFIMAIIYILWLMKLI